MIIIFFRISDLKNMKFHFTFKIYFLMYDFMSRLTLII